MDFPGSYSDDPPWVPPLKREVQAARRAQEPVVRSGVPNVYCAAQGRVVGRISHVDDLAHTPTARDGIGTVLCVYEEALVADAPPRAAARTGHEQRSGRSISIWMSLGWRSKALASATVMMVTIARYRGWIAAAATPGKDLLTYDVDIANCSDPWRPVGRRRKRTADTSGRRQSVRERGADLLTCSPRRVVQLGFVPLTEA